MQIKMELTAPHPILVGNAQFDLSDSFEGFEGASLFSRPAMLMAWPSCADGRLSPTSFHRSNPWVHNWTIRSW